MKSKQPLSNKEYWKGYSAGYTRHQRKKSFSKSDISQAVLGTTPNSRAKMVKEMGASLERRKVERNIEDYNLKAKQAIKKNLNVRGETLCNFGSLGLMSVEDLIDTFLGEELKSILFKKRK